MTKNNEIYNWPNFVSFIRILMVPVLFYFAINQRPYVFIGVIVFSEFTDVLDGFLARHLNQITELGSHLDSWGDFSIYTSMAICAWILWPEIIQKEWLFLYLCQKAVYCIGLKHLGLLKTLCPNLFGKNPTPMGA